MHCYELHLDSFKGDFLNISIFFGTLRFQILKYLYLSQILSDHNKPYMNMHQWKPYLFSFQIMYKVYFEKLTLRTGIVVQGHTSWNVEWIVMTLISNVVSSKSRGECLILLYWVL